MSTVKCRSYMSKRECSGISSQPVIVFFFVESAKLRLPTKEGFPFPPVPLVWDCKDCCYVATKMSQSQKEMFRIPFQAKKHPKSMFSFGRVFKKSGAFVSYPLHITHPETNSSSRCPKTKSFQVVANL